MQPRKTSKRAKPASKRYDGSDDESSQSFNNKVLFSLSKPSMRKKLTKKKEEAKKKETMVRNKSKSKVQISSAESISDSDENWRKVFKVPVEIFNSNQVFAEILNKANRQPEFLFMLKNLLSGCSRLREDKKSQYRKKWNMLRNSNNCTQDEYLSRQNQLKRTENEQIGQIEDDIVSKLSLANIRGFETKDSIVNNYKLSHAIDENLDYIVDEGQWQKYREQQKKLLQILMNENEFVSKNYKLISNTKYVSSEVNTSAMNKQEQNEVQAKFNNLQTEENQENIQFLFCKNFTSLNYDKVFDAGFKIQEDEKFWIDSKAMSWLLESKCDQIYTNEQFQKDTYNHYSKLLRSMYDSPQVFTESQIMNNVLESGAYILNSVHYYQKFKLKCDLLHPLDLLLVTEKLNKERNGTMMRPEMTINENKSGQEMKSQMEDENERKH